MLNIGSLPKEYEFLPSLENSGPNTFVGPVSDVSVSSTKAFSQAKMKCLICLDSWCAHDSVQHRVFFSLT